MTVKDLTAPAAAAWTVVCLPHAGGLPSTYTGWEDAWRDAFARRGAEAEVRTHVYPGRDGRSREHAPATLQGIAKDLVAALDGLGAENLVLYGHSMGALVGFEAARALCAASTAGRADRAAGGAGPGARSGPALQALAVSSMRGPRERLDRRDRMAGLDDAALVRALAGMGEDTDPQLLEMFLPRIRQDLPVAEDYRLDRRHDCTGRRARPEVTVPLLAFGAAEDPRAEPAAVARWEKTAAAGFTHRTLPGGHHANAAHREQIAETVVAACLG